MSYQAPPKPGSVDEVFGYLQRDSLNLIALGILGAAWLGASFLYNPVGRGAANAWLLPVGLVSLAALLTLALNQRHFYLASIVLSWLLLAADGLLFLIYRDGYLLYFAIPIINLANYLAGPIAAGAIAGGIGALSVVGLTTGLTRGEIAGPLVLALLTVVLAWLSSRHLYTTLRWAWDSHLRSLEKAEEAQRHRAELSRAHKALEEAYYRLNRLNEAFVEAWKAAEEAKRFKAEFAANVSHELRTPLYIIIGFSETMLMAPESYGQPLPAAYRSDLTEIYNSSRHLLGLLDDVLELSQIEAGNLGLLKEPTDVRAVIEEAVHMIQALAERKGLTLTLTMAPDLPTVSLDRTRIRQVLLNLLNNAVRYTDRGAIAVEARVEAEQLVITVTDTGAGIPADQIERIFESFYQIDASASRRHGGFGLGLAISKHFVEMHGGRIWAESEVGVGSRFSFALPLPAGEAASYYAGRLQRAGPPALAASSRDILLVHGDPAAESLLRRHLDGVSIERVADVRLAAQRLEQAPPRAILAEEQEAQELIGLCQQKGIAIPVIACPLPVGPQWAQMTGVDGYLVKPVTKERLLAAIERAAPTARRVLVVDDDPRVVRLLSRLLRSAGRYEVVRAFDGQEALRLMSDDPPDLVLLDLAMPELDGYGVVEHMERDPRLAAIPVVIVSAKGAPQEGIRRLQGSVTVTRPGGIAPGELLAYLGALLGVRSPRARPA